MQIQCTSKELKLFRSIGKAAKAANMQAFVIGGFVRDKLLGRATSDIDVVCTGDGIRLASDVAELFPDASRVSYFKNFGTAHIYIDEYDIEFVGARKESYPYGLSRQ